MRSISQVMSQTIQNISLGEEVCEGCGQTVKIQKTIVDLGGGRKREAEGRVGCYCEDAELAKRVLENDRKARRNKLLKVFDTHSLVPPELMDVTMNDYVPKNRSQEDAKEVAFEFVKSFDPKNPKNVLFFGPCGVGKSHLSRCMSRGVMNKGYSSIFISVPKLLRKLRGTFNKNSDFSEDDLISALETVDLLILDDIGAEAPTTYAQDVFFSIVDSRQGMSTVYTSNITPEEFLELKGERNGSRVLNHHTKIIEIIGENERFKNFGNKG